MAKTSPTQHSLKELRKQGYTVAIVEHWNPFAHIRQDLFGFIDLLAIREGEILGVQATSGSNHSARKEKSMAHKNFSQWIKAGGTFEIWSWAVQGARGKRKKYVLRREPLTLIH